MAKEKKTKNSKYQKKVAYRKTLAGRIGGYAWRLNKSGKKVPAPLFLLKSELGMN